MKTYRKQIESSAALAFIGLFFCATFPFAGLNFYLVAAEVLGLFFFIYFCGLVRNSWIKQYGDKDAMWSFHWKLDAIVFGLVLALALAKALLTYAISLAFPQTIGFALEMLLLVLLVYLVVSRRKWINFQVYKHLLLLHLRLNRHVIARI